MAGLMHVIDPGKPLRADAIDITAAVEVVIHHSVVFIRPYGRRGPR